MRIKLFLETVLLIVLPLVSLCNAANVIFIDTNSPATFETDPRFLSFTLDSSNIINAPIFGQPALEKLTILNINSHYNTSLLRCFGRSYNFFYGNGNLLKLGSHLSPAYFRIGGTMADTIIFYPTEGKQNDYPNEGYGYPINETTLNILTEAANSMNVDLIFDLNAGLLRFENGSWDARNAELIIKFCDEHNLKVNWQLGNEPDLFVENSVLPNIKSFNGTQMGNDVLVLKEILKNTNNYKNALLTGPDVLRIEQNGRGNPYLRDFLAVAGETVDVITWHHYYFAGATATVDEFLNPSIFSALESAISAGLEIVNDLSLQSKPKWLGETSSAYGGGAPNLSNQFLSTFIWLDKLGLSAKMGLKVVVRQSLIERPYALIDDETCKPNPDWWLSVLYKQLVGTKVVPFTANTDATVRLYVQCSYEDPSSITVFGVNLGTTPATVNINSLVETSDDVVVKAYELTSGSNTTLVTQDILLNGQLLEVTSNYDLPEFRPKIVDISKSTDLSMPAYSNVFWVISGVTIKACTSS